MTKVLKKCRIILGEDHLLGSLIYFLDKKGRPAIKFSFKLKVGSLGAWQESAETNERVPLKLKPHGVVSLDASYKFDDSLLEIKREEPGNKPHQDFIKIPMPMEMYLFGLRVKNWQKLPRVEMNKNALILQPPIAGGNIYIIISFEGENGLPFADELFNKEQGVMAVATLPRDSYPKRVFVGVSGDPDNTEELDLVIRIPNKFGPNISLRSQEH